MYNNKDLINELSEFIGIGLDKEELSKIVSKYKVVKLEEEYKKSEFSEIVEDFIEAKKLEGLSKNTLYGYKQELRLFNKEIRLNIIDIDVRDVRKFINSLKGVKNSTVTKKIHVLKSFFSWLVDEEFITKNPMNKIKPPKKEKRLKKALNESELELVRDNSGTLRARAMVEVMYSTGCRLSEFANIKTKDIDFRDKSCNVIGKGDKERTVLFSDRCFYYLSKYLDSRNDDCEYLFVAERKPCRKMSNAAIQREIRKIKDKVNIDKSITCHKFRSSFATSMIEAGANVMVVKELLGHTSLSVTEGYVEVSELNKRVQHKKYLN